MHHRAVFLDRDGVIVETIVREGRIESARALSEFRFVEGAEASLIRLRDAGFRLFVVSNQPDIARGLLDPAVLDKMTDQVYHLLPVERVFICVHDDADQCACRKPKPGMLFQAAGEEGIDLTQSFMVGDTWKDMQAGKNAGCSTILIRKDYNHGVEADQSVNGIKEAADWILGVSLAMVDKRGE